MGPVWLQKESLSTLDCRLASVMQKEKMSMRKKKGQVRSGQARVG